MATTAPTTAWTVDGRRDSLLDALGLWDALAGRRSMSALTSAPVLASVPARRALVVTAVGAGGKTSIVHSLAVECAAAGCRTVVTTTTHLSYDDQVVTDVDTALGRLQAPGVVVVGRPVPRRSDAHELKVTGFDDDELRRLVQAADVAIIEGDGARRRPFKVPAAHEPVVPADTDLLVVVAGLTALGQPVGEVCLRTEVAAELVGDPDLTGRTLDVDTAAALLSVGYLRVPRLADWAGRRVVALNQADTPQRRSLGAQLAAALPHERVVLTARAESE